MISVYFVIMATEKNLMRRDDDSGRLQQAKEDLFRIDSMRNQWKVFMNQKASSWEDESTAPTVNEQQIQGIYIPGQLSLDELVRTADATERYQSWAEVRLRILEQATVSALSKVLALNPKSTEETPPNRTDSSG